MRVQQQALGALLLLAVFSGRTEETIHQAAALGDVGKVAALLASGADVNSLDEQGMTPLHCAAAENHQEVVKVLIASKAFVDADDPEGRTALYLAASKGHTDEVKALLASGANPNAYKTGAGWSVLHLASMHGHTATVEALLAARAETNTRNYAGDTPLHLAVQQGHISVVKALLASGAHTDIKNEKGETTRDLAKAIGHDNILAVLTTAKQTDSVLAEPKVRWYWQDVPAGKPTRYRREGSIDQNSGTFTRKNGLPSDCVSSIAQQKDGSLLLGTEQGLCIVRQEFIEKLSGTCYAGPQRKAKVVAGNSWLPSSNIVSVFCASNGAMWVGTAKGTCRLKDNTWQRLKLRNAVYPGLLDEGLNYATKFYETKSGRIVIGTYNLGITIIDESANSIHTVRFKKGVLRDDSVANPGFVTGITEDSGGGLWFGTTEGLLQYDGKSFKEYSQEPWLPDKSVRSLFIDRAGNLWVGTTKGLGVRYADGSSRVFTSGGGVLPGNFVWHIVPASEERILIVTDKGVCQFDSRKEAWSLLDFGQISLWYDGPVHRSDDGSMWFATASGIIRNPRFKESRIVEDVEDQPPPPAPSPPSK